ncbi:DUF975 family protein [Cohnella pontilimi]|uniref:DUF975 family protein n=1 Tax=Cohnella pontilimi TaxID=2564100 RepID=A0A4U0F398_9BACL|nr:DUF975 family protein [Cohnella pontilimi]TJY38963.1 DUF975 family protein [Cohnella pontilimi]
MPTSSEIRAQARGILQGSWGRSAGHMLLLFIVLGVPLSLLNFIPVLGTIVSFLVSGAITYGLYNYYLDSVRGERPAFTSYFSGFNRFVDTFLLYLLMSIFIYLWTLLLIVPGIIAAIRYSQAYYILRDNPGISAMEAINRSKQMMIGHKWRFFVLGLSFIGWILLAIITFGIGLLWLYPYMLTSYACFYQDLKDRSASFS